MRVSRNAIGSGEDFPITSDSDEVYPIPVEAVRASLNTSGNGEGFPPIPVVAVTLCLNTRGNVEGLSQYQ